MIYVYLAAAVVAVVALLQLKGYIMSLFRTGPHEDPKTGPEGAMQMADMLTNPVVAIKNISAWTASDVECKKTLEATKAFAGMKMVRGPFSLRMACRFLSSTGLKLHTLVIPRDPAVVYLDGAALVNPDVLGSTSEWFGTLLDFEKWRWDDSGHKDDPLVGTNPRPAGIRLGYAISALARANNIALPRCFFFATLQKWNVTYLRYGWQERTYDPQAHHWVCPVKPPPSKWSDAALVLGYEGFDLDRWFQWAMMEVQGLLNARQALRLAQFRVFGGRGVGDPPPVFSAGVPVYDVCFPGDLEYGFTADTTDPASPFFGATILVGVEYNDPNISGFEQQLKWLAENNYNPANGGYAADWWVDPNAYTAEWKFVPLPGGFGYDKGDQSKIMEV